MVWRRRKKAKAALAERATAPPPSDDGPRRTLLADGIIEEISAATGRSILVPGTPARQGLDLRADAPGWSSAWRRRY
jgi:hypothetical protein